MFGVALCLRGVMAYFNGGEKDTSDFTCPLSGQTMHVGGGEKKPASMKMDDCEDEMEGEVEGEVEGESTWNDEDEKEFNKLKQRKMHTMKAVPH